MNDIPLALRQVKYENIAFWRNPAAAFFTCIFPLMFLVIFNLLFGKGDLKVEGGVTNLSTFYVPGIVCLSIISACYTNVAIGMSFSRDRGILKKVHGTPLPTWAFFFGRIVSTVLVSALMVTVVMLAGVLFYGVEIPTNTMPCFIVTLILGAATFSTLGIAISSILPNADSSPPVVNASILPLLFISDVFIPMQDAPRWLNFLATIFPVKPFSSALHTAFNPFEKGLGFEGGYYCILIVWMAVGILTSVKFFSWEPRN